MDKLRLAFKLITKEAKRKRDDGEIPVFLGAQGMLALMYDSITKFSKSNEEENEAHCVTHLKDLAVSAMFAFMTVMPDLDDIDADTEIPDDPPFEVDIAAIENKLVGEEDDEPQQEEDDDANDPRWTKVAAGDALPGTPS
tara:strand:+ start:2043 stop:2462 length:420 start_codon:yes stop_codon:yes gene_type:complete